MKPSEYAKAIVGAVLAGLTALGTALADGEGVVAWEWVGIAFAVVATFGTVFGVPNAPPLASELRRNRNTFRSESGQVFNSVLYVLACAFFALLIVWALVEVFGKM